GQPGRHPDLTSPCQDQSLASPAEEKKTALAALTSGEGGPGGAGHKGQPPFDHVFVLTTESKAAAAVRISTQLALRKRAEQGRAPARSLAAGLPPGLAFRTKGQIAIDLCAEAHPGGLAFD